MYTISELVATLKTHCDWSVHKLLEGRDAPIKILVATVSFALEPQKPMGEMLPDFLVVQRASTSSKHLLLDAKDHLLRASAVYGSSPTFNFSPTYKIRRAAPPFHSLTRTYRKQSFAQLSDPSHRFCPHLFSLTCHCFDGKLKKLLPWLSLYVPLR